MKSLFFAPSAFCLVLGCAPVPKQEMMDPYYPIILGTRWVYDFDGDEHIEKITKVKKCERSIAITIGWEIRPGQFTDVEVLSVSSDSIHRTECLGKECKPPVCVFQFPLDGNCKWEHRDLNTEAKEFYESSAPEKIRVPAGEFECVRVVKTSSSDLKCRRTWWYAKNVGVIQIKVDQTSTMVLKEFMIPKG